MSSQDSDPTSDNQITEAAKLAIAMAIANVDASKAAVDRYDYLDSFIAELSKPPAATSAIDTYMSLLASTTEKHQAETEAAKLRHQIAEKETTVTKQADE